MDAANYFKPEYVDRLTQLAKDILIERPGTTLHALTLEIANLHGLTRTSKKQLEYMRKILDTFAGIKESDGYSPTLWVSPSNMVDLIEWRGVEAFGYERKWNELSYEEALGLAKFAIQKNPEAPIDVICDELNIKRRHETSLNQFAIWLKTVNEFDDQK
ncbi:hypothetical protein KI745_21220 [Vibrio sp. D421a]|nr:hypothetical protein [Vibrio sp. D421a]